MVEKPTNSMTKNKFIYKPGSNNLWNSFYNFFCIMLYQKKIVRDRWKVYSDQSKRRFFTSEPKDFIP